MLAEGQARGEGGRVAARDRERLSAQVQPILFVFHRVHKFVLQTHSRGELTIKPRRSLWKTGTESS
jgi:hypothetical protein